MKKLVVSLALLASSLSAGAVTWWVNGVLYGNVCRNGFYYTVYPIYMGQPVGTTCPVRNQFGQVIMPGVVTAE
jgi:hypothetical protein